MKDDSTKGYIQDLASNDLVSYGSFADLYVCISSLKLVEGNGIEGVTNSFAAAIWLIDFYFEAALFGFYDVHY